MTKIERNKKYPILDQIHLTIRGDMVEAESLPGGIVEVTIKGIPLKHFLEEVKHAGLKICDPKVER